MFQLPWFAANSLFVDVPVTSLKCCSLLQHKQTHTSHAQVASLCRGTCMLYSNVPLWILVPGDLHFVLYFAALVPTAVATRRRLILRRHFATTSVACRRCLIRLFPLIRCLHSPYIHGENSTGTFSPKTWQPIQRATRTAYRVVFLRVSVVLGLISGETTLIGGSYNQSWHP